MLLALTYHLRFDIICQIAQYLTHQYATQLAMQCQICVARVQNTVITLVYQTHAEHRLTIRT